MGKKFVGNAGGRSGRGMRVGERVPSQAMKRLPKVDFSDKAVVLISGVPASGKSTYSRWLAAQKCFQYVDLEQSNPTREEQALNVLRGLSETRVVLDYGFAPLLAMTAIEAFKAAGVVLWWFDADWDVARIKFMGRDRGSVDDFDTQRRKVLSAWQEIVSIFSPNIIEALRPTGEYVSPEDLYDRMFP